jgi:hypothetical protein
MLEAARRRSWPGILLFVLSLPGPVFGQGGDPAGAEALFRRAREAKAQGDYATACPLFEESQRLDPSVGTLMNVAECEEHAGHLAEAWEHWHESLDQLLRTRDDRAALARARVEALEARVPKLTIYLSAGAVGGTQVARDGVAIGPASLGVPLPVDPGSHELTVTLAGHETARRTILLEEGQAAEVSLEPGPPSPDGSAPAAPLHARRTWGFVALGAGGVGLTIAVASAVVVLHEKSVVDADCGPKRVCSGPGFDAVGVGKAWVIVNMASSIFTVVAAGAGLTLVLTSRLGTTTVAPGAGRGQGGLLFTQVF